MKILFKHGNLVVDDKLEYLDGAILVEADKIIKVYPQTSKIKEEFSDTKIIDLKGAILMPCYFDTHYQRSSKGVASYLINEEDEEIIGDNKLRYLGRFYDNPFDLNDIPSDTKGICVAPELNNYKHLLNKNIKILLGKSNCDYDDINFNYDGIRNVFNNMKNLRSDKASLANAIFMDDKYIEFNPNMHISMLKLLLNNIPHDKLILISNHMHEDVLKLKELNVSNVDILAYTSLNAFRLYELDNYHGSLRKGKYADFIILDKNYKILFTYIKGEFNL